MHCVTFAARPYSAHSGIADTAHSSSKGVVCADYCADPVGSGAMGEPQNCSIAAATPGPLPDTRAAVPQPEPATAAHHARVQARLQQRHLQRAQQYAVLAGQWVPPVQRSWGFLDVQRWWAFVLKPRSALDAPWATWSVLPVQ